MPALKKSVHVSICLSAFLALSALAAGGGAAQGITPVTDPATGLPVMYPSYITEYNGNLYFRGATPPSAANPQLWKSDGASAWPVADLIGAPTGGVPSYLAVSNNKLYYEAGSKLWQFDGTTAGLAPGGSSNASLPQEMTAYNGNLYFRAARFGAPSNIGVELWKFDGTNQTPTDMFPGTGNSYPQHFIEYGGLLYFNACGEANQGTELWRTNGTAVANAATIYPNNGSSPENFAVYDNQLYFSAYDGTHGRELWRYNGSAPSIAADIVAGGQYSSSNPNNLCVFNGKLYFGATDGVSGYELWSFDGTTPVMVAEINPTPDPGNGDTWLMDSSPADLTVFDGRLYFSANDGTHGRELWSYDGVTPPEMVADINPGQYGSEPSELTVFNGKLYFSADDGYNPGLRGLEPKMFTIVPEPATLALVGLGALSILGRRRRAK